MFHLLARVSLLGIFQIKTFEKLTALSGWRYLYHHNQLVAEVPTIYHTDGNAALQIEIMRCEENWEKRRFIGFIKAVITV
ncbi:hypothetical protein HYE60_00020, partial [Aggregatibacter actinomycetemcomitans]|uniref:hypothetical protein n=1 Tax=Aggregatibacter actinomycetemcomitans TaxID=714 RepID=UPI00197BD093